MNPFSRNDVACDRPVPRGLAERPHGAQPTRRHFLARLAQLAALSLGALFGGLPLSRRARAEEPPARSASVNARKEKILDTAEFAYISPLRRSGQESTCHAELWYAWLDDSVVVIVSKDGWKARAQAQGAHPSARLDWQPWPLEGLVRAPKRSLPKSRPASSARRSACATMNCWPGCSPATKRSTRRRLPIGANG